MVVTGRSRTWGWSEEDGRATTAIEETEPGRSNLNPKPESNQIGSINPVRGSFSLD